MGSESKGCGFSLGDRGSVVSFVAGGYTEQALLPGSWLVLVVHSTLLGAAS